MATTLCEKAYVLSVNCVITTSSLPDGQEGEVYGQFVLADATAPLVWSVVAGALPTGLTLDPDSGFIGGTPDPGTAGPHAFTVQCVSNGVTCTKALSIEVAAAPVACVDWDAIVWAPWPPGHILGAGIGTFNYSFVGGTVFYEADQTTGHHLGNTVGSVLYTGPGCNCRLRTTLEYNNASTHYGFVNVFQDGNLLAFFQSSTHPSGQPLGPALVIDVPFAVIAGVNSLIEIRPGFGIPDGFTHFGANDFPTFTPADLLKYTSVLTNI
jgi:hypothetical protein